MRRPLLLLLGCLGLSPGPVLSQEKEFFELFHHMPGPDGTEVGARFVRAGPRPVPVPGGAGLFLQPGALPGTFVCDIRDSHVGRNLLRFGEYEELSQRLLAGFLRAGDVAVDAGANMGIYSVALSRAVGPAGAVLAFEPQGRLFKLLNGNLALNGAWNVHAHLAGLGEERRVVEDLMVDYDVGGNFAAYRMGMFAKEEDLAAFSPEVVVRMDVETLDHAYEAHRNRTGIARCPTVVKMDIEGMEAQALRGGAGLIRACRPILFVENNCVANSKALLETIQALGYTSYWVLHKHFHFNFFETRDVSADVDTISIDILALPDDPTPEIRERLAGWVNPYMRVETERGMFWTQNYTWSSDGTPLRIFQGGNETHCLLPSRDEAGDFEKWEEAP